VTASPLRHASFRVGVRWLALALAALAAAPCAAKEPEPAAAFGIAAEMARAEELVRTLRGKPAGSQTDQLVASLERALAAWRDGRRNLAILRFSQAKADIERSAWLQSLSEADRAGAAGFEVAWQRERGTLQAESLTPGPDALAGVRPALVRAVGEAALLQARFYHRASLPYGAATAPEQGLAYLSMAVGQDALLELARAAGEPEQGSAPPIRSLGAEIAAFEDEMLALYRPPAAIDFHADFTSASATLKEARELDEVGLHHGALLRYLQAALQLSAVRDAGAPVPPAAELRGEIAAFGTRLAASGVDHSIARVFIELAEADLASAGDIGTSRFAAAIARRVLPPYLAALESRPPPEVRPAPQVKVTLVRWPYT
jgi:hypothetical protein